MSNTSDQMQDAFPVVFEFVKGEQPTAQKLTGLVKHVNQGLANVTQNIGDPHDETAHAFDLSTEKLTQTSLARIVGPSDYLSPQGGSWNEGVASSFYIQLQTNRNSWELGYPLVKKLSAIDTDSTVSSYTPLVWATDIVVSTDTEGILSDRKTTPEEVVEDGDFFVDFYRGIITSYTPSTSVINLYVSNMYMLGSGVPWGTSNVIPHWQQTSTLCNVTKIGTVVSTTEYTLALPTVTHASRVSAGTLYGNISSPTDWPAGDYYDSFCFGVSCSGNGSNYRLPLSLIENASPGSVIPEGYIALWDNSAGRIVPNVEFRYLDENSLSLFTSEDYLTEGNTTYRIIAAGTSVSEAVGWLLAAFRDNKHDGLMDAGSSGPGTLRFTETLDHDSFQNLHTGIIPSTFTDVSRWSFRSSSYPVNPHPQYMHRGGYMADDEEGNSANAMRGNLVFATEEDNDFELSSLYDTYGIQWGTGSTIVGAESTRLNFEGAENLTSWLTKTASSSRPTADKFGFGIFQSGAQPYEGSGYVEYAGALALTPYRGTPLYLRGLYSVSDTSTASSYSGGVLGFDIARRGETNYIKVMDAVRNGAHDMPNQPIEYGQINSDTVMPFTYGLRRISAGGVIGEMSTARLSATQVREFRFRGGAYNGSVYNVADGLGAHKNSNLRDGIQSISISSASASGYFVVSGEYGNYFIVGRTMTVAGAFGNNGTYTISSVQETGGNTRIYTSPSPITAGSGGTMTMQMGEFDSYFTSPGMVGTDFLNIYSNAIFFSDTGDGRMTSFTSNADDYFNSNNNSGLLPTGLYYYPGTNPYYVFSVWDTAAGSSVQPLTFGSDHGLYYKGATSMFVNGGTDTQQNATIAALALLNVENSMWSLGSSGKIYLGTSDPSDAVASLSSIAKAAVGNSINMLALGGGISLSAMTESGGSARHIYIRTSKAYAGDTSGNIVMDTGNDGDLDITVGGDIDVSCSAATTINSGSDFTVQCVDAEIKGLVSTDIFSGATQPTFDTTGFSSSINIGTSSGCIQIATRNITTSMSDGEIAIESSQSLYLKSSDDVNISASNDITIANGGSAGSDFTYLLGNIPSGSFTALHIDSSGIIYKNTSSIKYKEDIETLSDISWIYDLRPVSFKYKDTKDNSICYGFIAEEVEELNTAPVVYADNIPDGLKYETIFTALTKAVQDQKKEIEQLKAQLAGK